MGLYFDGQFVVASAVSAPMSEPGILSAAAFGLHEALARAGIADEVLVRETGLEPESLGDPAARIPLRRFVHLVELGARRTGDDCFGLNLGASYPLSRAGVLWYLIANSATVGAALSNLSRYIPLQVDTAELELCESGRDASLSYRLADPQIPERRHYNERSIAIIAKALRDLLGGGFPLKEVRFEHAYDGDSAAHRRVFGTEVRFGHGTNTIVFDRDLLDREIATADPNLLQVLEHYIEDLLSRLPRGQRIEGRLRQYVMKSLKNGPPRLAEAARCLGMSPRTLQRRLKDKGLIFDRVVDETRCQLAESYLESSKLTASEIAYLLGYSELSAFTRAYRRWTGSTPKATRRRAKP